MAVQVRGLTLQPGTGGFAALEQHWLATQGYMQAAVDGGLVVSADLVSSSAPAHYEPDRAITRREAASWNVGTVELRPDPAMGPGDGQALSDGQEGEATLVAEAPLSPGTNAIAADDAGNIYLTSIDQVLRITPDGAMAPWVGSGSTGFADGVGTAASFTNINGICSDPRGNLYVTERAGRVRKIERDGHVRTLAGRTHLQQGALWSPWSGGVAITGSEKPYTAGWDATAAAPGLHDRRRAPGCGGWSG